MTTVTFFLATRLKYPRNLRSLCVNVLLHSSQELYAINASHPKLSTAPWRAGVTKSVDPLHYTDWNIGEEYQLVFGYEFYGKILESLPISGLQYCFAIRQSAFFI